LCAGRCTASLELPPKRFSDADRRQLATRAETPVHGGGHFLSEEHQPAGAFDARFFGLSPAEAKKSTKINQKNLKKRFI
jgi:acyl transferase domain-containing protein